MDSITDKKMKVKLNEGEYSFVYYDNYQTISLIVNLNKKGEVIKEALILNNRHSISKDDPQFHPKYLLLKNMFESMFDLFNFKRKGELKWQ